MLEGSPWMIIGHYLTVSKWRPKFRPLAAMVSTTLVWVIFLGMPLELLDDETL